MTMGVVMWMFFEAQYVLPMSVEKARNAMDRSLADAGLVTESRRAFDDGMAFLMEVGPRGGHRMTKQVGVRTLASRDVGSTVVVPLRWEATGASGRLFPMLDANIGLTEAGLVTTVLSVIGTYSPPLGRFGAILDRSVMKKVAAGTARTLLREIATELRRRAADIEPRHLPLQRVPAVSASGDRGLRASSMVEQHNRYTPRSRRPSDHGSDDRPAVQRGAIHDLGDRN
jgi:hypothetical protein